MSAPGSTNVGERLRAWSRRLKHETYALYIAYRDPRVPWHARVVAAAVVAYAFSPIDLIPDPIPVLGYLDDLLLVPAGVWLALRLMPAGVMTDARQEASAMIDRGERPVSKAAGAVIVAVWLVLAAALLVWLWRLRN